MTFAQLCKATQVVRIDRSRPVKRPKKTGTCLDNDRVVRSPNART